MKNNKGFTLVELIIAILIFTIVVALAGSLFVSGFRQYESVSERLTGQANTRFVMYEVSKALRNVTIADITINSSTSITVGTATYSYSSDTLEVTKVESGTTTVISRDIADFNVELVSETVNFSIRSNDESAHLNSSITLKEFTRPSPP